MANVVVDWIVYYASNFYRNVTHILDDLDATRVLRMVAIIGAYLLLRPYLLKFGAKSQAAEHEKEIELQKQERKKNKAKISANTLRGQVEIADSEDEEEGEGEAESTSTEPQWGKKARKRSRKALKQILEDQERLLEEDDNEDINEFLQSDVLVDFEQGKDGW